MIEKVTFTIGMIQRFNVNNLLVIVNYKSFILLFVPLTHSYIILDSDWCMVGSPITPSSMVGRRLKVLTMCRGKNRGPHFLVSTP